MATTRVYILAKELGVQSKAIVKKCQDEGLDVKNHMSTISAGLAATIREWFIEGENVSTVETSEKVDLKKVRRRKRSRKKKEPEPTQAAAATETVEAPPVQEAPVETQMPPAEAPAGEEQVPTSGDPATEPVEAEPETKPEAKPKDKPKVKPPQKPKKPEPVVPAGPMLDKPAPAELSGPKVIGFAPEEPSPPPRPSRAKPRKRFDEELTQPLISDETSGLFLGEKTSKKGSKHHKERTHGRRKSAKEEPSRKEGKWRQRDIEERKARLNAARGEGIRLRPKRKITSKTKAEAAAEIQRPAKVMLSEPITIKDLSAALAVKISDIIAKAMTQGVMVTANQTIGSDVAELIAIEYGTELVIEKKSSAEDEILKEFEEMPRKHLKKRSVVATMLGHVDHGKTSLLDKIRSTQITDTEAGGITQHIGAYQVGLENDKVVTFLDTPGHEAFTAMRARGANMTDVVVLVVAADDGVMPQTVEAIHHAKAAEVPIIIALNKIDLPGVDINRIYSQFSEHELTPAEWGGDTEVVKTSAVTGEGIEYLLEHLDYIAELLELKADDTIPANGWVVEARKTQSHGPVATLLIKEGKLSKSDVILAGTSYGRVKTLRNSFGKSIKSAVSSMPVEVTGLSDVPEAGDRFFVLQDMNRAKSAAEEAEAHAREKTLASRSQVTLDNLFSQIEAGNVKELNIIIRADVQGSVDVLKQYLSELSTDEVKIKILHAAPGGITEGDVVLAEASNAIIIGFNVSSDEQVAKLAESKGVDIRLYNIIYRITEDLQKSMVGLLEPEEKEEVLGRAVVRQTFKVSRLGTIAGCYVNDGIAAKSAKVRLIRDNIVIRDNLSIDSLKHFKDDVREVKNGFECGIKLVNYDDLKIDDVMEFYKIVQVARAL